MAVLVSRAYGYSKMVNEDPEETKSRRAQFLIYKSFQKADARRRPTWLRVRMFKLKVRIGKRLKKLKKGFSSMSAKPHFFNQIASLFKSCKLLHAKQDPLPTNLHPIF